MKKAPRKNPTPLQKKELQQEAESQCAWCGDENPESWEFHHIDGRRENTVNENLILLCGKCHNIAEANNGKITMDDLYQRKRELAVKRKNESVQGTENVQNNTLNGIHVNGNFNFSPKQVIHNKTKIIEKYIPGTIESDPKLSAYLKHLMNVYNPLFAEDCKIKKRKSTDYSWIRRQALEQIGYQMEKTPIVKADELFAFIREKISETIIGRQKISEGKHLVSTFEEFNRKHNKRRVQVF